MRYQALGYISLWNDEGGRHMPALGDFLSLSFSHLANGLTNYFIEIL